MNHMKQSKKRVLFIMAAVLLAVCLLSGCAGSRRGNNSVSEEKESVPEDIKTKENEPENTQDQKTELEIWVYMDMNTPGTHYVSTWKKLAKKHNCQLNIKTYTTQEMKNKLRTGVTSRELPDIFMVKGGSYSDFLFDAGVCLPLQDYIRNSNSLFKDPYLVPYKDGNNYIIPCFPDSYQVTYANLDLLEKMNLKMPETWEQLLSLVHQVHSYNERHGTNYTAIELGDKDGWLGELLYCTLVNSLDPSGLTAMSGQRGDFSDRVYAEAAGRIRTLVSEGAFSDDFLEKGELESAEDFKNGNSVLFPYTSGVLYYLEENMGDQTLGLYQFPSCSHAHDLDYTQYNIAINYSLEPGLCVSSYSTHQKEAVQLCLEYATAVNEINVMKYGTEDITRKNLVAPATFPEPVQQFRNLLFYSRRISPDWYGILPENKADSWNNLVKKLYAGEVSGTEFQKKGKHILKFEKYHSRQETTE